MVVILWIPKPYTLPEPSDLLILKALFYWTRICILSCSQLHTLDYFQAVVWQFTGDTQPLENMPALWSAPGSWWRQPGFPSQYQRFTFQSRSQRTTNCCTLSQTPRAKPQSLQAVYQIRRLFKFHSEILDRETAVVNGELLTNWKGSSQALKNEWRDTRELISQEESSVLSRVGMCSSQEESPQPMSQDCDYNGSFILGDPGLSLWPSVSLGGNAFGCTWPGVEARPPWSGMQHPPLHCRTVEVYVFNAPISLPARGSQVGQKSALAARAPLGAAAGHKAALPSGGWRHCRAALHNSSKPHWPETSAMKPLSHK